MFYERLLVFRLLTDSLKIYTTGWMDTREFVSFNLNKFVLKCPWSDIQSLVSSQKYFKIIVKSRQQARTVYRNISLIVYSILLIYKISSKLSHPLIFEIFENIRLAFRVSSKQTKYIFGSNRNKPKLNLFRLFFGLFRETIKLFFLFVSVFRINIETTETNRSVSKQTEKKQNKINGLCYIQ
jgi:hypothetical protein